MELHHRLRRDPSWHPSGCNICGQLGHQAANCTTGTVNWRSMYGEDVFRPFPSLFQSEVDARKRARTINYEDLEARARDYAKMREENPLPQQPAAGAAGAQQQAGAAAADDPAKAEEAERRKAAEEGLPEGWAVAFSADKKPYYWHKQTKKTVWDKPTADTPTS